MQVPAYIQKCVVFIGCNTVRGLTFRGTAFFVGVDSKVIGGWVHTYLVTAKHIIDNIKRQATDGKVMLRLNNKNNGVDTISTSINEWKFHPTDALHVDVAVLPVDLPDEKFDMLIIPEIAVVNEEVIKKDEISAGDDIFLTGLFFKHKGKQRNLPIIRVGNIALMPEEKIYVEEFGEIDAYLIEARSIGGHSGSPVFVNTGPWRLLGQRATLNPPSGRKFHWLGLMHGHWNLPANETDTTRDKKNFIEQMNMGIAIVIPAQKILEVINRDDFLKAQEKKEDELKRKGSFEIIDS